MTTTNQEKPNVLGQPITTRHRGAFFYCLSCEKEYRQCKCRVYVSADTLKRATPHSTALERAS